MTGGLTRVAAPAEVLAMSADRHHIVAASAGTGKTFLIEHRVVDLILRGAINLDAILVVTFTEKATAELRLRVRRKLEELLADPTDEVAADAPGWTLDADARRRLEDALLAFDRAPIFTIHGFCNRVVGESAFARGSSLHATQVAGQAVFAEVFAELVRTDLTADPACAALLEAWFLAGNTSVKLRSYLWSCRERGGVLEPRLEPADLRAAIETTATLLTTDGDPLSGLDLHHSTARAARRWLDAARPAVIAAAGKLAAEPALAALAPAASEIRKLAEKADQGLVFAAFAELDAHMLDLDAAIAGAFLPRIEAAMARRKQLAGQIDFSDMLVQVASALEGPGGDELAADLRERYPVALIDEFQDTSELQWQIFRRIYLDHGGASGARLTVVGDPKQAIYGFRGADLHTYHQACAQLRAAGASELTLRTNYRSTPALIDAFATIIDNPDDVGDPFFAPSSGADAVVVAGRDTALVDAAGAPVAPVLVGEFGSNTEGSKWRADELAERIATFYADEIASILGRRSLWIVPERGVRRAVRASDILVLARSRSECVAMADALSRRGVATSLLHKQDLFTTREASELLDLLRGIAMPRATVLRSRALATRYFDLPLAALTAVSRDPDSLEALADLHRWRNLAEREALETLLPRILAESRIVERELALDRGLRTVTNIEHLIEILVDDVVRSRCSLLELCNRLEARVMLALGDESLDATPLRIEAEADAVQIMTVHAAKGLEAAIVFVYGGTGRRSIRADRVHTYHDDESRRRLRVGRPPDELLERIEDERDREDERLMYVAVTRAAARLVAVSISPQRYAVAGAYAVLNRRLTPMVTHRHPTLFERRELDANATPPLALVPSPPERLAPALPADEPELPPIIDRIRGQRTGAQITSYSRIKRGLRTDAAALAGQLGNDHPGIDAAVGSLRGREVGIFLHWILERISLEAARAATTADELAADEGVSALIGKAMRGFSVESSHRGAVEALIHSALITPLRVGLEEVVTGTDRASTIVHCEREAREVEFTYPINAGSQLRGYVTGYLDVLAQIGGKLFVVDWKSDALPGYDDATLHAHVAENYAVQTELYSLALARILGGTGAQDVTDAFGGVIYVFLRGGVSVGTRASTADLAAWSRALAERLTADTSEVRWRA